MYGKAISTILWEMKTPCHSVNKLNKLKKSFFVSDVVVDVIVVVDWPLGYKIVGVLITTVVSVLVLVDDYPVKPIIL